MCICSSFSRRDIEDDVVALLLVRLLLSLPSLLLPVLLRVLCVARWSQLMIPHEQAPCFLGLERLASALAAAPCVASTARSVA